jgi:phosphate starvation-inducible PhoH-like protein
LDEAQNTTVQEIKMFLTRSGENCITVINGDISQCDIDQSSGLYKAIVLIKELLLPIPVIEFTFDDIVRSDLCAMWSRAFETTMFPQKKSNQYDIYKDIKGVKPDSWKQFEYNNY